ncbi:AGAP004638-PA [Anopheles gambiae str. PEST]|uniref:AGAP004638-PA n=2 Tax=gambiae species complex TaxID=44542 RepID=Q7Q7R3_ANOGA|nr:serine protease easter-like [Anopheles coluzzii]XP_315174.5 serine protease easter [Anopheles gambiae]EAA10593.5 AGAP004638-PA [Anopheles gambiae str. PEST]
MLSLQVKIMVRILVSLLLLIAIIFIGGCPALTEKKENNLPNSGLLALVNQTCGTRYYESNFPVDTRLFEHPWLVQFGYERELVVNYVFQGLLIHSKYVLTTVFVVQFQDFGQLKYARVGEHNTSTNTDCEKLSLLEETCAPLAQSILVDEVIVHPDYNMFAQINDIALVKLRVAAIVDGTAVAPICVNDDLNYQSSFLLVASWCGRRETGLSLVPKQYFMKPISPYECQRLMPRHSVSFANGMFCIVFDERHTNSTELAYEPNLRGGSGAPIYTVHDGNRILLVGLLSYGPRYPAKLHEPYVIIPVAPFYDWMTGVIEADREKHMYNTLI